MSRHDFTCKIQTGDISSSYLQHYYIPSYSKRLEFFAKPYPQVTDGTSAASVYTTVTRPCRVRRTGRVTIGAAEDINFLKELARS